MKSILAIGALLLASTQAWALSYTIGNGSSVSLNSSDPGLVVHSSMVPGLAGSTFVLNDGQSTTLSFFRIWTSESAVNADDRVAKSIIATLDFLVPDESAIISGTTRGATQFLGLFQAGVLTWTGPALVTAADRVFSVALSDAVFNQGVLWGLGCKGATVEATITQVSSTVPDSATTLSLLGLALLGLVAMRRRVA